MSSTSPKISQKCILAFVGMPGSGKSIVSDYLKQKKYPVIRFGDLTDSRLQELGLDRTPKNEERVRELLRNESGMAVYAVRAAEKIRSLLQESNVIIIDGLYSWEEYVYVKKQFSHLLIIQVFAEPRIRYERLAKRTIRPFTVDEAKERDLHEITHLSKGGPIAVADFIIENDSSVIKLSAKIELLLQKILSGDHPDEIHQK